MSSAMGDGVEYDDKEVMRVLEEHGMSLSDMVEKEWRNEAEEFEGESIKENESEYTSRTATKEEKKAHKKLVKEQKREKRKSKIPKSVKKRAEKQGRLKKK